MQRKFRKMGALLASALLLTWLGIRGCDELMGNRPVRVSGRVVDQYGNPLSGVKVSAKVTAEGFHPPVPFWGRQVEKHLTRTTDEHGKFTLHGATGMYLLLSLNKPGYTPQGSAAFGCNPSSGVWVRGSGGDAVDLGREETQDSLLMWREDGTPHLLRRRVQFSIVPDDRIYQVSLHTPHVSSPGSAGSGNPCIQLRRSSPLAGDKGSEWQLSLSTYNGGFIETGQFASESPKTGYKPKYEHAFMLDNAEPVFTRRYYFHSAQQKLYAALEIQVRASESRTNQPVVTVTYCANHSGGRELDFDSSKVLQAQ